MAEASRIPVVLDSWPLIEWLRGHQPMQGKVANLLADAVRREYALSISRINLGEVIYIGRKEIHLSEIEIAQVLDTLRAIPVEVFSATDARVDAAVDLKARYSISYADAFAAALGIELGAPIVTGDKEFRALEADGLVQILWLGA